MVLKAFQYRLYPSKAQSEALLEVLETCRRLYNRSLAERRDAYEHEGKSLNYYDQANTLKDQRRQNPYLARVNYSATQDVLRRLDKAFQAFFRRVKAGEKPGYPRFKAKGRYDSVTFPAYGDGCRLKDGRLYLQNVGRVKLKLHRPLTWRIKTVTVRRKADGWHASQVSRREKGSNRRGRAVRQLARAHLHIANQRKDTAHKVARSLVSRYGLIAVEDLQVGNMLKNHRLAGSISDAGWNLFVNILKAKAAEAGRQVVEVDPRNTSQTCSGCGRIVPKPLSERWHTCPVCGTSLHRDVNAAINILRRAAA